MGRRALTDRRKRVNVYISESLLTEFSLLHFDPARGRTEFGVLSETINQLLREHLSLLKKDIRNA